MNWKSLIKQSLQELPANVQKATLKAENIPKFNFADDIGKKNLLLGLLASMGQGFLNVPSNFIQGTTRTGNAFGELLRGDQPSLKRMTSGVVPLASSLLDASLMTSAGRSAIEKGVIGGFNKLASIGAKPALANTRYIIRDGKLAGSNPIIKEVIEDIPQWTKTATGEVRNNVERIAEPTIEELAKNFKFKQISPSKWIRTK